MMSWTFTKQTQPCVDCKREDLATQGDDVRILAVYRRLPWAG